MVLLDTAAAIRREESRKCRCQSDSKKENGRATSGDRGWGADGSSSPAFAWGQALGLGGGDCQRNDRLKQSSCLEKTAINLTGRRKFFSLSATRCTPEVLNWAIFREDKPLLQLAMGRWMRSRIVHISTPVQLAGCRARTALACAESERCDRATLRHCEIDRQLTIEDRESNLISRVRRTPVATKISSEKIDRGRWLVER